MNRANNTASYTARYVTKSPSGLWSDGYAAERKTYTYSNPVYEFLMKSFLIREFVEIPMLYIHTITFKVTDYKRDKYYVVTNTKELDPQLVAFAHTKMCKLHGKDCAHIGTNSIEAINQETKETINTSFFITKFKEIKN